MCQKLPDPFSLDESAEYDNHPSFSSSYILFFSLSAPSSKRNRQQNQQQQVEQAKSTLEEKISKLLNREEKMDNLEDKAEALEVQAFAVQKAVQKIPKQHRPLEDDFFCLNADFAQEAMSSDNYLASSGSLILWEGFSEEEFSGDQLTLLPQSLDVSFF